ncbi:hypothetical protein BKA82DRAFT_514526 [Pisolithus tinctorius]|uniref:Uncharacterized protein n=1 Tax=Pisolithus tinctorius Marx 270 TaxID=870435 RepID=A0A0C3MWV9_PISTI|nr:hypothetical protein BKA82DRAFT_514526 [Pisolithus tinctorius]KIN93389.1 hypothetical protein M404DRAFT_514526 [Pisolithus tinctorius Marx 270]
MKIRNVCVCFGWRDVHGSGNEWKCNSIQPLHTWVMISTLRKWGAATSICKCCLTMCLMFYTSIPFNRYPNTHLL